MLQALLNNSSVIDAMLRTETKMFLACFVLAFYTPLSQLRVVKMAQPYYIIYCSVLDAMARTHSLCDKDKK